MKIGINALFLLPGKVGGSEIYLRNLVRCLAAPDAGCDAGHEYVIFVNRECRGVFEDIAPGIEVVECAVNAESRVARILWEQCVLPFQVRRRRLDLLFSAGMTAPFLCPVTSVLMIFDLQHVNLPENFSTLQLFFLRTIIYLSAKSANHILTLSEKSKTDIVNSYRIKPARVTVTYLASDTNLFRKQTKAKIAGVRKKYNLPESFVLYPASSLPHKNYGRLLEAFKTVKDKVPGTKLLLTGTRDYGHEEIFRKIKELQIESDVVVLGWLPFEDIALIYNASSIFVFPSLHEGFGLPVLEAMGCGVPVVCSGIEPITEVAGEAARFVDPYSVAAIANGLLSVLEDKKLAAGLVKKGLKRVTEFSWEATAEKTTRVFESFKGGGKPITHEQDNFPMPKISIITPSLNQGEFIEDTIKSVLSQDYPNLEFIIMDGGSTDRTIEILKRYEDRLTWVSEKDEGQTDAINKGIGISTGEIVAYLNSDDLYLPGTLKRVAGYFAASPEAMWLTGGCRIIDINGKKMRGLIASYKNFLLARYSYNKLLVTNFISQPATFLRRALVDECGLFDKSHHLVMDYEYWLRAGEKYDPAIINQDLSAFRVHGNSKTSKGFVESFKKQREVARGHSTFSLDLLHYLSNLGICTVYTLLGLFGKSGE